MWRTTTITLSIIAALACTAAFAQPAPEPKAADPDKAKLDEDASRKLEAQLRAEKAAAEKAAAEAAAAAAQPAEGAPVVAEPTP
jgi:hypothetical protein